MLAMLLAGVREASSQNGTRSTLKPHHQATTGHLLTSVLANRCVAASLKSSSYTGFCLWGLRLRPRRVLCEISSGEKVQPFISSWFSNNDCSAREGGRLRGKAVPYALLAPVERLFRGGEGSSATNVGSRCCEERTGVRCSPAMEEKAHPPVLLLKASGWIFATVLATRIAPHQATTLCPHFGGS